MPGNSAQVHISRTDRDNLVRNYVDRHSGAVVLFALLFAIVSCVCLVIAFGLYASIGGNSNAIIALGLSLWLALNGFAIRRFMTSLHARAAAEREHLRAARIKPVPQAS